jgi:hypothetical protein
MKRAGFCKSLNYLIEFDVQQNLGNAIKPYLYYLRRGTVNTAVFIELATKRTKLYEAAQPNSVTAIKSLIAELCV